MAILNVRIDETTKKELQEIAKLKNISLSHLTLQAINEMIENEFDYKLCVTALERRKTDSGKTYPIADLYQEYEV